MTATHGHGPDVFWKRGGVRKSTIEYWRFFGLGFVI